MVRSLRSAAICTRRSGVEVSLSNWLCFMFMSLNRVRNAFRFMAFPSCGAAELQLHRQGNATDCAAVPTPDRRVFWIKDPAEGRSCRSVHKTRPIGEYRRHPLESLSPEQPLAG